VDEQLSELKEWVQYNVDDAERLSACLSLIQPHLDRIIDAFYDEILRHPGSRDVISGPKQVARLKRSLVGWLREVFEGPHDAAYAVRRRAIGVRHVQVGLQSGYMYAAMHLVQREVGAILRAELPPDRALEVTDSLHRVCTMDLALMTNTYVSGREKLQLDSLHSLLVAHLRTAVFLVGTDGVVRSATRASTQLLTGKDATGRKWTEALPDGLVEAASLEEHVQRGLKRRREVTLPRVDVEAGGKLRSFRIHVVPLLHELATFLIQVEELTDAIEMEARVSRSEALAQLGSLSAAVAHELRNPLAGISGALQVITRSMDEETPHHRILSKVEGEVRRLNSLVTDLLAFARPGSATLAPTSLRPVIEEVVELMDSEHPDIAISIEGEAHGQADPHLVSQIVHNLLRNAVDAVREPGAHEKRIDVVLDGTRLRVEDAGPGIPVDRRDAIFQPFETSKTRGTGLGLAISTRSAEAMNASLSLAEGALPGACFELTLLA
jgi:signal transduction histidine kinase